MLGLQSFPWLNTNKSILNNNNVQSSTQNETPIFMALFNLQQGLALVLQMTLTKQGEGRK